MPCAVSGLGKKKRFSMVAVLASSVIHTGATWLALRSADEPYRLIIPLVPDVEWRFLNEVRERHDEDAVKWIKEAAHVAQWWVAESWRRSVAGGLGWEW